MYCVRQVVKTPTIFSNNPVFYDLDQAMHNIYIKTNFYNVFYCIRGTAVAQWLRCCATNRKVAGSIPDGFIGIFHCHNPSDPTVALGSTQPLTEMSARMISWG